MQPTRGKQLRILLFATISFGQVVPSNFTEFPSGIEAWFVQNFFGTQQQPKQDFLDSGSTRMGLQLLMLFSRYGMVWGVACVLCFCFGCFLFFRFGEYNGFGEYNVSGASNAEEL